MSGVISIPALRVAGGPSVAIQSAAVDGTALHAVSVYDQFDRRRHFWFRDRESALAYAVGQADALGLLLLDLTDDCE